MRGSLAESAAGGFLCGQRQEEALPPSEQSTLQVAFVIGDGVTSGAQGWWRGCSGELSMGA